MSKKGCILHVAKDVAKTNKGIQALNIVMIYWTHMSHEGKLQNTTSFIRRKAYSKAEHFNTQSAKGRSSCPNASDGIIL